MSGRTLVTGGCGFIGTNMVDRILRGGGQVVVLDDLSRPGVRDNLDWLRGEHGRGFEMIEGDVRDPQAVRAALEGVTSVFHFAAQVAVTTSVSDPRSDFGVNLGGTVNLLEEMRRRPEPPGLLFTSTNKVYGDLEDLEVRLRGARYEPVGADWRRYGVGESRPLHFCSPYGCSKGGADQYVLDYAKSYGLRTVVFRMSCIYGPHQQGNEDQGWVAHFLKQILEGRPITLYGDGHQVRDVLYVGDLMDAMGAAMGSIGDLSGRAFNLGGGPRNTVSLLELLEMVGRLRDVPVDVRHGPWRVGDQRWYVSDTRAFESATRWSASTPVRSGVESLCSWLEADRRLAAADAD
jgi:CDP-paratose 2-epimerase